MLENKNIYNKSNTEVPQHEHYLSMGIVYAIFPICMFPSYRCVGRHSYINISVSKERVYMLLKY